MISTYDKMVSFLVDCIRTSTPPAGVSEVTAPAMAYGVLLGIRLAQVDAEVADWLLAEYSRETVDGRKHVPDLIFLQEIVNVVAETAAEKRVARH